MRAVRSVDLFCGGGGTSGGLLAACQDLGRQIGNAVPHHLARALCRALLA